MDEKTLRKIADECMLAMRCYVAHAIERVTTHLDGGYVKIGEKIRSKIY